MTDKELTRFLTHVDKESRLPCWLWTGAINENGYGVFGLNKKTPKAHRVIYEHFNPNFLRVVRHKCNNRWCVNPAHLTDGYQSDNIIDSLKINSNGVAKLTTNQVLEIRTRIKAGETNPSIASDYNVTKENISSIRRNKTWWWL